MHIEVPRVKFEKLTSEISGESSAQVRDRVEKARAVQNNRFKNLKITTNSEMNAKDIREFCKINSQTQDLLKNAVQQLHLSARSYHRILKIARTIADLANDDHIKTPHVAEALQYRAKME